MTEDTEFYRRRIDEEQVRLAAADNESVRSVSRNLIEHYNARLQTIEMPNIPNKPI